jgi:hypothetical protein
MANPAYAAAYAEMKAELDREFLRDEEGPPFAGTPASEVPAKALAKTNGNSRRTRVEKTGHASRRK